jgi:hypothetical protein
VLDSRPVSKINQNLLKRQAMMAVPLLFSAPPTLAKYLLKYSIEISLLVEKITEAWDLFIEISYHRDYLRQEHAYPTFSLRYINLL